MKQLLHVGITWVLALMLGGCLDDNSYDGKNGLIGAVQKGTTEYFISLQKRLYILQSSEAQEAASAMVDAADIDDEEKLLEAQNRFKVLASSIKAIEATYIAGDLNSSLIDTLRLMDIFHEGNEDITLQLEAVASNESNVSTANLLYKNSLKSINALEYMLFKYGEDNNKTASEYALMPRRAEIVKTIANALNAHVKSIANFYATTDLFGGEEEVIVDALINRLIDSAYKLKEWRIGEPAGFTNKYKNDPDALRLEYHYSGYSYNAMVAIVKAYEALLSTSKGYENFGSYLLDRGADMGDIQKSMQDIITLLASLEDSNEVEGVELEELYTRVATLYDIFYNTLPSILAQNGAEIDIAIIEADGD